jgi:MarR family transcriptional regulator for hemolysin
MPNPSENTKILFLISDVARLLRTYSDQHAKGMGLTRAQWAVLLQLKRNEGLIQTDLAGVLDLKPITLTRLIDRLCKNKLVERRQDPNDRRARFLFLTPAARGLLDRIVSKNEELAGTVFEGIEPAALDTLADRLGIARDNLRRAIERRA